MRQNLFKNFLCVLFLLTCNIHSPLRAAAPPDAGQVIQEIPKEEELPIKTTPLEIDEIKEDPMETGGEKVLIESFIIKGNEAFSSD